MTNNLFHLSNEELFRFEELIEKSPKQVVIELHELFFNRMSSFLLERTEFTSDDSKEITLMLFDDLFILEPMVHEIHYFMEYVNMVTVDSRVVTYNDALKYLTYFDSLISFIESSS